MKNISLEKALVFYLSPSLAFLVSLIQAKSLNYIISGYAMAYVLGILVIYRTYTNSLVKNYTPILILVMLCAIEYLNFLINGVALNDMTDIRMILYSPLFSPIIVFVFYGAYLSLSNIVVRYMHLIVALKVITYTNIFFIFYWTMLYIGIIPQIESTSFLNANSISYSGLFVLLVLLIYGKKIGISASARNYYSLINASVLFLNTTRGAILILFFILLYLLLRGSIKRFSIPLAFFTSFAALTILMLLLYVFNVSAAFFGERAGELYSHVSIQPIEYANVEKEELQININGLSRFDDYSLSSITRIYTNYVAAILFIEKPLFGIGTVYALSIKVLGEGIHSFNFLLLVSTGLVGVVLLVCIIVLLGRNMGSKNDKLLLAIFAFSVLLFTNQLPIYFVYLFLLSSKEVMSLNEIDYAKCN